jgi:hypothetical protein
MFYDQTKVSENFYSVSLNKTTFPLTVWFSDYNAAPVYDPRYLTFQLAYNELDTDAQGVKFIKKSHLFELENCTSANFPQVPQENFNSLGLTGTKCIKDYNFTLFGYWGEKSLSYLSAEVSLCDYD